MHPQGGDAVGAASAPQRSPVGALGAQGGLGAGGDEQLLAAVTVEIHPCAQVGGQRQRDGGVGVLAQLAL